VGRSLLCPLALYAYGENMLDNENGIIHYGDVYLDNGGKYTVEVHNLPIKNRPHLGIQENTCGLTKYTLL